MKVTKSKMMFSCLCVFIFAAESFGQTNDAKKFERVPVSIREGLIKRLNLFLEYDQNDQYEKKYEMLSENTKTVLWKRKDDYVKFEQDRKAGVIKKKLNFNITKLISFDIRSVEDSGLSRSPDFRLFKIKGVVNYRDGKKLKKKELPLEATFEKDEWYFSDWLEEQTIYD